MPYPQFDRSQLRLKPLRERANKVLIERDHVAPDTAPRPLSPEAARTLEETIGRVKEARQSGRPVMLAFGAHTIKNGLAPVLIRLMEQGWVTHLATNGAGIIHDWEFAFQGASSEDVRANVARGEFGLWQETGLYISLALAAGAYAGLGYGESIGALIQDEGLLLPDRHALHSLVGAALRRDDPGRDGLAANLHPDPAAALDLLAVMRRLDLPPGWLAVPHPYKAYSAQAAACRLKIPFTGHPMFGHDIIYTHPANCGAAIGRTAERDFLAFANSVSQLQGGVYLSVGSAVMSPMIFEKALSMAQNLHLQQDSRIDRHLMVVVDLAEARWDWQKDGEPPQDHPAYYLRYCKSFSRMGGVMRYLCADNRDFLLALSQGLGHS